ncbi:uncharacterized protein DDB_G0284459 isoform X2 [Cephus cinctus]|uniref:Uncharacterized protein DDB_G0284459 isoform X2 n=2 Tax=Cephus cinctus TaxID=211228 RepID=A0AAJ7BTK9_CEPCN|nr:uncharacterized protein DDB_G0284459 isoform X2 [Cephus cinctus]
MELLGVTVWTRTSWRNVQSEKMRLKPLGILVILFLSGYCDARPQKDATGSQESRAQEKGEERLPLEEKNISASQTVRGNNSGQTSNGNREFKDLQDMDQSLRTVATQLLNVTNPDESNTNVESKTVNDGPSKLLSVGKSEKVKKTENIVSKEKPEESSSLIKEINSEISNLESMGVSFGRPVNSKFGYFESGHPGQAMAITEEELEKELSGIRETTVTKNVPTTSGGISTWILLNPPSTTPKTEQEVEKKIEKKPESQPQPIIKSTATIQKVEQSSKIEPKPTATIEKVQAQTTSEKNSQTTSKVVPASTRRTTAIPRPDRIMPSTEKVDKQITTTTTTRSRIPTDKIESITTPRITTTKKVNIPSRTTVKTKVSIGYGSSTTPRPSSTKIMRPNFSKPNKQPSRTTTQNPASVKTDNTSSPKIEKVTFRPVQMISTSKPERPMFINKIKASVLTEMQKSTTIPPATITPKIQHTASNFTGSDLVEVPMKIKTEGSKVNNVLKVQLKKPVDETTTIEIEPIKVNTPVLNIEKVEKVDKVNKDTKKISKTQETNEQVQEVLNNSQIDLKFDFNPELTKVHMESSTEVGTTSTTKRPRHSSNKRKKNKVRRRKPLTSTTLSTSTTSASTTLAESYEISTESNVIENSIQESKVEPETNLANATKKTKKPLQKPISTQIYNFLSREVMPSFGVMSLVGLGLGLASYFLYPFGGVITRRNYDVEPNYKYNLDEYGGNYGQNEEEVFSKVLQGMTNHDSKFGGIKDYENNYYRYQHYDGPYVDPKATKNTDQRYPTSVAPSYGPIENAYDLKYRNTEFKYPDVPTTSNYYDRQKQEFAATNDATGNPQFVVGNVPKEYSTFEKKAGDQTNSNHRDKENVQTTFEQNIAQNYNFPKNPVNLPQNFAQPEAQALRVEGPYEEIQISPTAVAVEHGPRALKVKRSADLQNMKLSRKTRESVIQIIPSKSEMEMEEKEMENEENLSNEILDILDSVIPGSEAEKKHKDKEVLHKINEHVKAEKKKHDEKLKSHEKHDHTEKIEAASKLQDEATTSTPAEKRADTTSMEASREESTQASSTSKYESTTYKFTEDSEEDEEDVKDNEDTTVEPSDDITTEKSENEHEEGYTVFGFVKRIAEIKFRLGLTILKHASEGFARYLGHVQKRINGEE